MKRKVKNEDESFKVTRQIIELGIGWSFDKYSDKWRNQGAYQVFNALEILIEKYGEIFDSVLTGHVLEETQIKLEQDKQKEYLEKIHIPIEWGRKGLPKMMLFFHKKEDS